MYFVIRLDYIEGGSLLDVTCIYYILYIFLNIVISAIQCVTAVFVSEGWECVFNSIMRHVLLIFGILE